MIGIDKIRTEVIRMIRRARLPLTIGQELDLYAAYNEMKLCTFSVNYEPTTGFHALRIKFGKVTFNVFKNGTITIMGMAPKKDQEDVLNYFWVNYLRLYVVEKYDPEKAKKNASKSFAHGFRRRKRILKNANNRCSSCDSNEGPFEVHHKKYSLDEKDLVVLCRTCHNRVHGKRDSRVNVSDEELDGYILSKLDELH